MVTGSGTGEAHLVLPPYTPPMVPNLGMPSLDGALRRLGIPVVQTDLNIRLQYSVVHERTLLGSLHAVIESDFAALDRRPSLNSTEATCYLATLDRLARAASLLNRHDEIAGAWKAQHPELDPLPFGYPSQQDAFGMVDLFTSAWGATRMLPGKDTGSPVALPEAGVTSILEKFFGAHLSPDRVRQPRLFGVSVLYESQLACAELLLRWLRRQYPEVPIVAGGPAAKQLARLTPAALVDAIVLGEGEEALCGLYADADHGPRRLRRTAVVERSKAPATIPEPHFSSEELGYYWSHPLALPMQCSRGCYWNRCAFCSYRECYSGPRRSLSPREAARRMYGLHSRYGCRHVQIVDDCVSPAFLSGIAAELERQPVRLRWSASARLEPQFDLHLTRKLARAGCCRLTFGMESADQQMLNSVRKGTRVECYLPILQACRDSGIAVHLNWIAGLPGESAEALQTTIRFLEQHNDLYSFQFGHVFRMEAGSLFATSPGTFGLPPNVGARPFHTAREEEALRAKLLALPSPAVPGEAPQSRLGPLRLARRLARVKVNYDTHELRRLVREGRGRVKRLAAPEWALLEPWQSVAAQFSEEALIWVEDGLLLTSPNSQVKELMNVLYGCGLLEGEPLRV